VTRAQTTTPSLARILLFFAMAAQVLLLELKTKLPTDVVVAYHDDFTLAGPRNRILDALEVVM
jgi:hypothetical protein